MEEENVALGAPDETAAGIEAEAIDADWNSPPGDGWGTAAPEDEDGETGGRDEPDDGGGNDERKNSGEADQSFTLKHLKEVKTVGRDEVIALAQKGLDYDRIRGKYDEASGELARSGQALALMRALANVSGMTTEDLMDATRAQLLTKEEGLDPAQAIERVRAQRAAMERQEQTPEDATAIRRQTEIRDFIGEYGTAVDPGAIPREVWQAVAGGKTLLSAYQAWELKKLRTESRAVQKNTENKEKSAGSRRSAGASWRRDAIADDWYDS